MPNPQERIFNKCLAEEYPWLHEKFAADFHAVRHSEWFVERPRH